MLQLVYISTARQLITPALCDSILATSRVNNRRSEVTGLLVAGRKRFLQAIEGPTDALRQTFARIAKDPRHYACVVLAENYCETRQFGDWEMAYRAGGAADEDASLEAIVAALVAPIDDANLRAQFNGFAALQAKAA
jgi:hypothetical protein